MWVRPQPQTYAPAQTQTQPPLQKKRSVLHVLCTHREGRHLRQEAHGDKVIAASMLTLHLSRVVCLVCFV